MLMPEKSPMSFKAEKLATKAVFKRKIKLDKMRRRRIFFLKKDNWDLFDFHFGSLKLAESNLPGVSVGDLVVRYGLRRKAKDLRSMGHYEATEFIQSVPKGKICEIEVIIDPNEAALHSKANLVVSW